MAREISDETQESGQPAGQPPLNRAMRRMQQREDARQSAAPTRDRRRPPPPTARERTSPRQFGREVRAELRKVAWPGRPEVVNSTAVVLIAVVVLTSVIFGFDYALGKFVLFLYE
jgi:preprotein translocase subunit SecE